MMNSYDKVGEKLRRIGMKARKAYKANRKSTSLIKWGMVNWDDQDVKIAKDNGCSRERVRQKRKELGVGKSPSHHRKAGSIREKIESLSTECMLLKDIARTVGCSVSYALQTVMGTGRGYRPELRRGKVKYDWSKADWNLTDAQVAIALGVANVGVVSQYRFRHGIVKKVAMPVVTRG